MRILLAIDFDIEARLLEGILVSGHEVVDRVAGADALIESVTRNRPDVVIAQGGPETLTTRSLASCDASGSRIVVLMADELERRNAIALGIVDRLDAEVDWPELQEFVRSPGRGRDEAAVGKPAGSAAPLGGSRPSDDTTQPVLSRRERKQRERAQSKPSISQRSRRQNASTPEQENMRAANSSSAEAPANGAPELGRAITVWGPYGAPGRTSIAIGLAASFANRGLRVVLIDADPYGGAVAQLLGIADEAPGLAAACRLAGAGALNRIEFDRVSSLVKTPSASLRVLSGIVNPERWPELRRARVRGVIEQAKIEADIVVIDVGFNLERDEEIVSDVSTPRRNAATHTALEHSDSVVALAEATPLGMQRYLRARLHLLECVGADCRIESAVNRVRGSVTGVDAATQIRQVLRRFGGIEQVTLLPNDPKACDRALANALSIVDAAPRSQLSRQIGALADRLTTQRVDSASKSLVGLTGVEHHQPHSAL